MDELRAQIENAIAEVINTLSLPVGNQDLDLCDKTGGTCRKCSELVYH